MTSSKSSSSSLLFLTFFATLLSVQGSDFNEAFSVSVTASVEKLITVPWTRVNNIIYSAFNSRYAGAKCLFFLPSFCVLFLVSCLNQKTAVLSFFFSAFFFFLISQFIFYISLILQVGVIYTPVMKYLLLLDLKDLFNMLMRTTPVSSYGRFSRLFIHYVS
jgi:hypothetical protein